MVGMDPTRVYHESPPVRVQHRFVRVPWAVPVPPGAAGTRKSTGHTRLKHWVCRLLANPGGFPLWGLEVHNQ